MCKPLANFNDRGQSLAYDAWNRLLYVGSILTPIMTYAYDGQGWRVTETTGGGNPSQLFYSSSWQVLEERITSALGTSKVMYVYSPVYVDAVVLRDYDFTDNGSFQVNERVYAIQDANFDTTALVIRHTLDGDADGNGGATFADYLILQNNYNKAVVGGDTVGDFDHNGYVNFADYLAQQNFYNQTTNSVTWIVGLRFANDAYGNFTVLDPSFAAGTD